MRSAGYLLLAILLFARCAQPVQKFPSPEIIPATSQHHLPIRSGSDSLRILYMGCGHLVMQYKNEGITTDPFFSTQPLMATKVKTSTDAYAKYMSVIREHAVDLGLVKSVWLAHTHYDHMMDVPMLMEKQTFSADVRIYGNENGDDILTNFISPSQYQTLESIYQWITVSPSIRVMPLISDHAPHLKIGPVKLHFMKGDLQEDYFREKLSNSTSITRRNKWKEGDVYSFLMDFMEEGRIVYRIFIQSSASKFPQGSPPVVVLKEHPIDVAILCMASSNTVKPYPGQMLKTLKPAKMIFIHWEDFFSKPVDFETPRLVRCTSFKKIMKRLHDENLIINKETTVMPRPGTMITIK